MFRNQYNRRTAGLASLQGQPSSFTPHGLYDKNAAMGASGDAQPINVLGDNVDR